MREKMIAKLLEKVREAMGAGYTVEAGKVTKNNGRELQAVLIRKPGDTATPTVYIDGLLEWLEDGKIHMQDAVQKIIDTYQEGISSMGSVSGITAGFSRESILGGVVYQVINREMNVKQLIDIPHKGVLDLAVVYRAVTGGNASILVSNSFCDAYGISPEELDAAADRNTKKQGFFVQPLSSILGEMCGMDSVKDAPPLWVLSNPSMCNGAAVVLYGEYFASLAAETGGDLYVLPSSIHEVIAVPAEGMDPAELREMVAAVNAGKVAEDEVLSGNVYRYSREKGALVLEC